MRGRKEKRVTDVSSKANNRCLCLDDTRLKCLSAEISTTGTDEFKGAATEGQKKTEGAFHRPLYDPTANPGGRAV